MDDESYLNPGFDPASLKVAELRGVLFKHDVDFPSSAKKADLVKIFNTHIAPYADSFRSASLSIQPSTRGMVSVNQAGEAVTPGRTPGRRSMSSRRSVAPVQTTDEEEELGYGSRSVRKTPARRSVGLGLEDTGRRSTRRSSVMPPSHRHQESIGDADVELTTTDAEPDTPFSSFNPFQGGGTPNSVGKSGGKERSSRKSLPTDGSVRRRGEDGGRRKTDFGGAAGYTPVANKYETRQEEEEPSGRYSIGGGGSMKKRRQQLQQTGHLPTIESQSQEHDYGYGESSDYGYQGVRIKKEEEDPLAPSEEFVPEEAAELAELERTSPPMQVARRRPARTNGPGMSALWLTFMFIALAYGLWWRREKIDVGYCGVSGFEDDLAERDAFAALMRPECEPCPPHASCYPGMQLECDENFIKVNKWSSLGGLLPIPPDCIPDTEKERKAAIMTNAALEILRENGAEQRCKESFLRGDIDIEGVSEEDLRQVLYDRKAASLSDREFNELWRMALEETTNRDEIIVETNPTDGTRKLKSISLAALPLGCSIRFFVLGSVAKHSRTLSGITAVILSILYAFHSYTTRRAQNEKVTRLVLLSIRHLQSQARAHPDAPYIAVAHLRDQVLRHEFDPKKRQRLWQGVEKVVEQNSNIRAGEREVEGEIMRAWTWIGGKFVGGGGGVEALGLEGEEKREEEEWDGKGRIVA